MNIYMYIYIYIYSSYDPSIPEPLVVPVIVDGKTTIDGVLAGEEDVDIRVGGVLLRYRIVNRL